MKKLLVLSCILFFAACSAKLIAPSEADATRASAKFPGTSLADLAQGRMLYEQNCKKCHGLKKPQSHNEEQWRKIVPKMAQKAKVDDKTENLILRYVVTMSTAGTNN